MTAAWPLWGGAVGASPGAERIETACLYAVIGLTVAGMVVPALRYAAYATPLLCLVTVLARRRVFLPAECRPLLGLVVVGLAMIPLANMRGLKDLYLIAAGASVGLAFAHRRVDLAALFGLFVAGHVAVLVRDGRGGGAPVLDLAASYSSFETVFAFLFGLVAVCALAQGRRVLAVLACLAAVLAFKLIVILALLACALVWCLPRALRRVALSAPAALIASAVYLALVVAFTQGAFDDWIRDTVGRSANAFSMGRQFRYGAAVAALSADWPRYLLIGDGPGAAYDYLAAGTGLAGKANLHNDLLKILIDYGGLALAGFITLLYVARTPGQRLAALYTHVLLLTDNVLIYHFYLVFFVLLGGALAAPPGPPRAAPEAA